MTRSLLYSILVLSLTTPNISWGQGRGLPESVDPYHFHQLVESSPFSRSLNSPTHLILTGIATDGPRPFATVLDPESGESLLISAEPNEKGWRLGNVHQRDSISESSVELVTSSGEIIKIRHDEDIAKKRSFAKQQAAARGRRAAMEANARAAIQNAGNGTVRGGGVAPGTQRLLGSISQRQLPSGYDIRQHQKYVDARMANLSSEKKGRIHQLWMQQQAANPQMQNRGESFVRILDYVERSK
ncbi:MAG: hypothetical protein AAF226_04530 [Verrucomicrobiota bacterium]